MGAYYAILNGREVQPCTPDEWSRRFAEGPVHVADETIGGARVSTVFLGMNHGFGHGDRWFETMVFGGPLDGEQARYETWEQAAAGHADMVARVQRLR